ncbi:uncharacterized protein [Diadema antillarum]|uniref:uncharacterized protein n=1 Tax=Diadema antillarum TaxID=105358 RepID=UPI003A89A7F6
MPTGGKAQEKSRKSQRGKLSENDRRRDKTPAGEPGAEESNLSSDEESTPAGQSSNHSFDSTLKDAIERQIGHSLRSPDLVKQIANEVFEVIAAKLEERVTSKVYNAVSLDLQQHADELNAMKKKISDMQRDIKKLNDDRDDAEQYSRRNCLRVYGVREDPNERTDKLLLDLFNSKMGLQIPPDAIDRSHRITPRPWQDGAAEDRNAPDDRTSSYADTTRRKGPRTIIIKFSRYNARSDVYKARTRLRDIQGPKIFIREDLTASRAALYRKLVNSRKAKTCWTQDGIIFALNKDAKRVRISSALDIENM